MIKFTDNCRLNGAKVETSLALLIVSSLSHRHVITIFVSSFNDGEHMRASLHKVGFAFDLWSTAWDAETKLERFANELREALTPEFDVIVEWTSLESYHIHVEFQPK